MSGEWKGREGERGGREGEGEGGREKREREGEGEMKEEREGGRETVLLCNISNYYSHAHDNLSCSTLVARLKVRGRAIVSCGKCVSDPAKWSGEGVDGAVNGS